MARVGAVVLNYGRWPESRAVVDALLAQSAPPDRILVVDNGSGQSDQIEAAAVGFDALALERNMGYASGMNAGVRVLLDAGCDLLLLLTHDAVLEPTALAVLVGAMQDPAVGVAAPLLGWRSSPEAVWSAGGAVSRWTSTPFHPDKGRTLADMQQGGARDVAWVDGAAVLVRAAAHERVGGVPEDYFLYFEEVDYQHRIRTAGYRVVVVPQALAWQEPGSTPPYLAVRNHITYVRRCRPTSLPGAVGLGLFAVAKEARRLVLGRGQRDRLGAYAAATLHGLTGQLSQRWLRVR